MNKKICERCKHYRPNAVTDNFESGTCSQPDIVAPDVRLHQRNWKWIEAARDVCDKEGDGRFVYFEPKEPSNGTAIDTAAKPSAAANRQASSKQPRPLARAAAGGVV